MSKNAQKSKSQGPEVIIIKNYADSVSCDGGHGSLGHPVVWYSYSKSDIAECMYCDRVFVKERAKAEYDKSGAA